MVEPCFNRLARVSNVEPVRMRDRALFYISVHLSVKWVKTLNGKQITSAYRMCSQQNFIFNLMT